jgi:hypothetical protein
MDISRPGFAIDPLPAPGRGTTLAIERASDPDRESDPWQTTCGRRFSEFPRRDHRYAVAPAQAAKAVGVPVVAPIYDAARGDSPSGTENASRRRRSGSTSSTSIRAIASWQRWARRSSGTFREPLMASAWEQLGEAGRSVSVCVRRS